MQKKSDVQRSQFRGTLKDKTEDRIVTAEIINGESSVKFYSCDEEGLFAECHKMLADAKTSSVNRQMGIIADKVGYAWILDSTNNVIWHNGGTGNYNCYSGFNLEQQKAVIVLSNLSPDYRIPATVIGTK